MHIFHHALMKRYNTISCFLATRKERFAVLCFAQHGNRYLIPREQVVIPIRKHLMPIRERTILSHKYIPTFQKPCNQMWRTYVFRMFLDAIWRFLCCLLCKAVAYGDPRVRPRGVFGMCWGVVWVLWGCCGNVLGMCWECVGSLLGVFWGSVGGHLGKLPRLLLESTPQSSTK
jgi:hypothetical protein